MEWGTHVYPWLIHVNVWQKPLQYCKVISLQLKLINYLKKTNFQKTKKKKKVETDFTLLTNVHIVKAMVFPVVMYRCENWTVKEAEHQRTDAFDLWCRRRLS